MNFQDFFTSNTWWGKVLGGFFGFLIGGPVGAFLGVLIGNFFDQGLAKHFSNPLLTFHLEKRKTVQKIFFESTFSVMGHLAKADGRVSEQELELAKALMGEMQLSKEQIIQAKKSFNQGKLAEFKVASVLQELKQACKDNRELLRLFVDIQYRAAKVDGLSSTKIAALDHILVQLGFAPLRSQNRFQEEFSFNPWEHFQQQSSSSSYQKHYQAPKTSVDQAYAILDINPNASKQEVKRAYRRLMSQNHPDKLIAKGLPAEMIKMANDKTQRILKAYEMICKYKGW